MNAGSSGLAHTPINPLIAYDFSATFRSAKMISAAARMRLKVNFFMIRVRH